MDNVTYVLSRKYTDDSISGTTGVLKGAPCEISSIAPITGGNRITFKWQQNGSTKTQALDVMDGIEGNGIQSVAKLSSVSGIDTYRITFTDGSHFDYQVKNGDAVQISAEADNVLEKKTDGLYVKEYEVEISADTTNILEKKTDGLYVPRTSATSVEWGTVVGDIEDQTDLVAELNKKVDKVAGKGLSANDYTDADKSIVDGVTTNLALKADKATTYTKSEVDNLIPDISGKADKSTTYTKTEVDGLLDDKQDSLPTVTNDKYLHTNASTGALEWADGASGGAQIDDDTPSTTTVYSSNKIESIVGDIETLLASL